MTREAEENVNQLETGLDGTPQGWNLIMLAAKRLYSLGKIATPALLKVATSKKANPITRKMAIEIISDLRDTRAIGPFVAIARDTTNPPGVRDDALSSLGHIGTDEVVDSLLIFIRSDDILLKRAGMSGIRAARSVADVSPAFEPIAQIAQHSTHTGLRESAVLALSAFGDRAVPLLTEMLSDQDDRVRCKAIYGLSGSRSGSAVGPLVKLLSSSEQEARTDAVMALQILGDTTAVPALIEMLPRGGHDASDAAFALTWIGDERALEPLKRAIERSKAEAKDPGSFVRAYESIKKRYKAKAK